MAILKQQLRMVFYNQESEAQPVLAVVRQSPQGRWTKEGVGGGAWVDAVSGRWDVVDGVGASLACSLLCPKRRAGRGSGFSASVAGLECLLGLFGDRIAEEGRRSTRVFESSRRRWKGR